VPSDQDVGTFVEKRVTKQRESLNLKLTIGATIIVLLSGIFAGISWIGGIRDDINRGKEFRWTSQDFHTWTLHFKLANTEKYPDMIVPDPYEQLKHQDDAKGE